MSDDGERFDFETVLRGGAAKDWACASDLQNLTRCRNLAACQGLLDTFDRCTASNPLPPREDDDDDDDDEEVAGGPVSRVAIAIAPQVFDGDAPRKKTWLSETLERILPAVFKGDDDDKDD